MLSICNMTTLFERGSNASHADSTTASSDVNLIQYNTPPLVEAIELTLLGDETSWRCATSSTTPPNTLTTRQRLHYSIFRQSPNCSQGKSFAQLPLTEIEKGRCRGIIARARGVLAKHGPSVAELKWRSGD